MKPYSLPMFVCFWACTLSIAFGQFDSARLSTLTRNNLSNRINKKNFAEGPGNTLHLIYEDVFGIQGSLVRYSFRVSGEPWSSSEIVFVNNVLGKSPSLGVDPEKGTPYVVYQTGSDEDSEIEIAYRTLTGNWIQERITDNGLEDVSPNFFVDPSGELHIVWLHLPDSSDSYVLRYAHGGIGELVQESIPGGYIGTISEGVVPFIVGTKEGEVFISYRGQIDNKFNIFFAYKKDEDWRQEEVFITSLEGFEHALALSPAGNVYIAVGGIAGASLTNWRVYTMLWNRDLERWSNQELVATSGRGTLSSLAVDKDEKVNLLLDGYSNGRATFQVLHAFRTSTNWAIRGILGRGLQFAEEATSGQLLFDAAGQGYCAAIRGIDPSGQSVVVYGYPSTPQIFTSNQKDELPQKWTVYPNPTQRNIWITKPSSKATNISILNLAGEKVFEQKSKGLGKEEFHLKLPVLPQGLYMIHMENEQGKIYQKLQIY